MPRKYIRKTNHLSLSWAFRQLPFWERVAALTVKQDSGCHIFTGFKTKDGYGRVCIGNNKLIAVHRAVWELHHGKLEHKQVVCHKCDTPACINPEHLFVGTQSDNIKDMDEKGRRRVLIGSQQTQAKLRESQIPDIRKKLVDGVTCVDLAKQYGVSDGAIRNIKKNRRWTHVL